MNIHVFRRAFPDQADCPCCGAAVSGLHWELNPFGTDDCMGTCVFTCWLCSWTLMASSGTSNPARVMARRAAVKFSHAISDLETI
jgi:hypothetical protein